MELRLLSLCVLRIKLRAVRMCYENCVRVINPRRLLAEFPHSATSRTRRSPSHVFLRAQVHEFHVEMTCEGCSGAVQRVLGKLADQGVNKVDIDLKEQRVLVDSTLSSEQLLEVLKKAGKTCSYVGVKK